MDTSTAPTNRESIVKILTELLDNRFYTSSNEYGETFWTNTIEGLVAAKFVGEGYVDFNTVFSEISNAWDRLLEHWFSTHLGTDIGFLSLAEIESDSTLDRLQRLGLVDDEL